MRRKAPMKRTGMPMRVTMWKRKPMKRTFRSTRYGRRERYTPYMLFVKTLSCCARRLFGNQIHTTPCDGEIEADHAGRRGMSQKSHDSTVIPMCSRHHFERANFTGMFKLWDQSRMRTWLANMICETKIMAQDAGVEVPVPPPEKCQGWQVPS